MNVAVGEKELVLGEKRYVLRPSFRALAEIEARAGIGIQELFDKYAVARNKASETVIILYSCMKHGLIPGDVVPTFEAFGEACYAKGVVPLAALAQQCVIDVIVQGRPAPEEKKS